MPGLSHGKADILFERRVRPRLREVASFFEVSVLVDIPAELRRQLTEEFLVLTRKEGRSPWEAAEELFRRHRGQLEVKAGSTVRPSSSTNGAGSIAATKS